jgi:hypothetical protein
VNPQIPLYIEALLFLIIAIIVFFILYSVKYALASMHADKAKTFKTILVTSLLIVSWLVISALISLKGTLHDFTTTPPKILLVLIPPVLAIIYVSSSKRVNAMLDEIPPTWLIYIQSFRILMELLLWLLFIKNIIPVQMTFEGINYDILTGLSAALVGYYVLSVDKWPRIVALLWNYAGLLLVTNIFLVALLSTPSPMRQFFNEPANTLVAYFPFVWIPACIVPFAYLMHVLSIKQLLQDKNK